MVYRAVEQFDLEDLDNDEHVMPEGPGARPHFQLVDCFCKPKITIDPVLLHRVIVHTDWDIDQNKFGEDLFD